jgi:nucleoside-diphosphate-sugar epimerase
MTYDSRALIGHTGFVGSNLDSDRFTARFNSRTITDATGLRFGEVVCAGVQAVKWWANRNPEEDWAGIRRLLDVLETVKADRFVLISTVDVYKDPNGCDEDATLDLDGLHAYGTHRRRVEEFVLDRYQDRAVIVRLPGLFGPRLKKNLIFDLMEGRDVSGFNPNSTFQFYDITRLQSDLDVIERNKLALVNLAVEPVRVADVATVIGGNPAFLPGAPKVSYDMQTRHAGCWGRTGRYIADGADSLLRIGHLAQRWASG